MALIANPHVPKSTLIDVTGEPMPSVEVAGMDTCQPMDVRRNCVVLVRPQHQMPVVGHQAVGDDAHRNSAPCALHKFLKMQVVVHSSEQRLSVNSTVEDVIDMPARSVSSCSCHSEGVSNLWATRGPGPVKETVSS